MLKTSQYINAVNGPNNFLLQLKDWMMEASWRKEEGPTSIDDPILATRVGVRIKNQVHTFDRVCLLPTYLPTT